MQMPLTPEQQDCITLLQNLFKKSVAESVSSLLGESAETDMVSRAPSSEKEIWFRSDFRPAGHGYLAFGAVEEPWLKMGNRILMGSDDERADSETILSTLREISAQVTGAILANVNHAYRKQIEVDDLLITDSPGDTSSECDISRFRLRFPDGLTVPLTLVLPHTLLRGLVPPPPVEKAVATTGIDSKKLEMLLDVEMPVSVSIGRAHMPLKDVMKLTTGSVVELNRNVSEPVDIVVNNCVVARGDVVVVDGNFGVRIREVLSKEDRMRRLGTA